MMDRDDWLSPAAFVTRIVLSGGPNEPPALSTVTYYNIGSDEITPVTQEWVNAAQQRLRDQFIEIERLRTELESAKTVIFSHIGARIFPTI